MMTLLTRLFARGEAVLSEAAAADARAIAKLHAASFRHGWSDGEIEGLLLGSNVIADRATIDRELAGFILSRVAADEGEVLSIAVDRAFRQRGLGRRLLQRNLLRLADLGIRSVFLEVDANNEAALALYAGMGFSRVGQRPGYYRGGDGPPSTALVLRRHLD